MKEKEEEIEEEEEAKDTREKECLRKRQRRTIAKQVEAANFNCWRAQAEAAIQICARIKSFLEALKTPEGRQ